MKNIKEMKQETQTIHAGTEENEYGAVVTPICQTSTFKFKDVKHGANLFAGKEKGYIYTRMLNPTVEAMENCIATLEKGHKALGCASGMAAIHTVFATLLQNNDHVICSNAVYGPTNTLLNNIMEKFGVKTTFVDSSNIEDVKDAFTTQTKLIFLESPGNPTLAIADIEEIAKIAHEKDVLVAVDNTFMGPVLQNPIELGADIVVHSMTKSLNGHADVVGGIIVVKDEEMYKKFRSTLNHIGGIIDPFNSFLVHRGIKTLAIRIERSCENAMKIAKFLEQHPKVKWVRYPGLASHPGHEIAKKSMRGFGAMISFGLQGGLQAGELLMNNVKLCTLAVSLGGVETLIQHPASMTHAGMSKEHRIKSGITDGLVRLSVGIENVDDLISDLKEAFDTIDIQTFAEKENTISSTV